MKTKFRLLIFFIILVLAVPTTAMAVHNGFEAQPTGRSDLNLAVLAPPVAAYDPEFGAGPWSAAGEV